LGKLRYDELKVTKTFTRGFLCTYTANSVPHFLQEFSDLVQADILGDSVELEAKVDDSQATYLSITEQARGVILVALVVEVVLLIVALVVKVLVLVVMLGS